MEILIMESSTRDLARRQLIDGTISDLEGAAEYLRGLRDANSPTAGDLEDARTAVKLLREDFDALDDFGWR
jgi:hypothetical protein